MKRIVCLLLALVLTTGALPLTTFAEGECTCTAESCNAECSVCAEGTDCPKKQNPPAPEPVQKSCTCSVACTKGNMNSECAVCGADGATLEDCKGAVPTTYTVTYQDSEDPANFEPQSYTVNGNAATPAFDGTPTRECFLFDGWNPAVDTKVTANATYTAKWAEAVTITYKDGKGGAIFEEKTLKVKKGDPTPEYTLNSSYTSWTFEEWYPAVEETAETDTTYTARWTEKGTNKLVLDSNGGTAGSTTEVSTSEASATIPTSDGWTKENHEWNGWNTQADGNGTSYDEGDAVNFDGPHNGQTITLYAQWVSVAGKPKVDKDTIAEILEDYKVKIAPVDDENFSIEKDARDVAGSYALKGNDDDGYTLEVTLSFNDTLEGQCKNKINDHNTSPGETTKTDDWKFYPTADHPRSQTVTFTYDEEEWNAPSETTDGILATFYMNQYFTVTYTDGVDSVELFEDQTTSVAKGADTPQFTGTPTRTGYGFDGWDKEVAETVTADVTYTARWKANTYTVKFHANGGSGTMADQTLTYDVEKELTKNAFTRKGHKFTGWADKEDTNYADKAKVKNLATGGEVSLTAQWIPSVERVDFRLSGYGYKKEITSAKVSPGENLGVSYGTGYGQYGDNYGITNSQTGSALSNGTFADKKDYYLYVTFYVNQGYTHEDLTKDDVFLDGVPALSLTGKEDQAATQALDDEAGTELTAVFKLKTIYLIKASAGKNGAISPKDTVAVFQGDDVTFTITPDKGYVRSTLKVDDKKVTTAKTYTFKDVQASHTIRATFAKDSGNAKTGDDLSVLWALAAAILSAAALATVLIIAKKKKK